jgi:hypothetical protein
MKNSSGSRSGRFELFCLILLVICVALANSARAQVWTQTGAGPGSWLALASSADGKKLAAVNNTQIYTSPDAGSDWFLTSAPVKVWKALAYSADGSILVAVASSGGVYTSTNGNTWQSNSLPLGGIAQWDTAAASADGNTLIVGGQVGGPVCYSTNRGGNWSSNGIPTGYWTSVVCSADGSKLAAAWSGTIYVSPIPVRIGPTTIPAAARSLPVPPMARDCCCGSPAFTSPRTGQTV